MCGGGGGEYLVDMELGEDKNLLKLMEMVSQSESTKIPSSHLKPVGHKACDTLFLKTVKPEPESNSHPPCTYKRMNGSAL